MFHVSTVQFLRLAFLVLRDMVDVTTDCKVTLFHVEPLGVPPFQKSVQRHINVLTSHSIPELQIYTVAHLGTTTVLLLQLEQVSEEVELWQNPQKRLTEMNKDRDV